MVRIIDNVLSPELLELVKGVENDPHIPWYYCHDISGHGPEKDCYFTHTFLIDNEKSGWINLITPVIDELKAKAFVRIKANCYFRSDELIHHTDHVDFDFDHKGAIFYLNTNDGYTVIGDTKVESVENRLLLFDPQVPHHSTNCTDQQRRVNINFNYF